MDDIYYTIDRNSKGEFKDKGSKFYAFAFPVSSEEEVKQHQEALRKEYYDARHHVYAFMIGTDKKIYRDSDDGEPANSSGKPVLGQIKSHNLTNILIVVIRYFGGVKLGIPGLINAYRSAANDAITNNKIIKKVLHKRLELRFDYPLMKNVMRVVKEEQLEQSAQTFEMACCIEFLVKKSEAERVLKRFEIIYGVKSELLDE